MDIIFPNAHGYLECGPTWIYTQPSDMNKVWPRQTLPNDSGWMSRAVDVDGDGYLDLIVVNGENGVTSELDSYIYWGGPDGLSGDRTVLPTVGAYDVAAVDGHGTGRLDLIPLPPGSTTIIRACPGLYTCMSRSRQASSKTCPNATGLQG